MGYHNRVEWQRYSRDRDMYEYVTQCLQEGGSLSCAARYLGKSTTYLYRVMSDSRFYNCDAYSGYRDMLVERAALSVEDIRAQEILCRRVICLYVRNLEPMVQASARLGLPLGCARRYRALCGPPWSWPPLSAMGYDVSSLSPQARADIGVLGGCY